MYVVGGNGGDFRLGKEEEVVVVGGVVRRFVSCSIGVGGVGGRRKNWGLSMNMRDRGRLTEIGASITVRHAI